MPAKWKIFFALNIIIALPAFIFLIFAIISFFDTAHTGDDFAVFLFFIFSLSMITFNGFLNIFLLQRYYPAKLIPAGVRRLALVSLILIIITTLAFLIVSIIGAGEEFSDDNHSRDITGKIALAIFALFLVLQIIILFMQGQLPRLIRRNHQNTMHSLIDSIGQTTVEEN